MFDNQRAVALELTNEAVAIAQRPIAERAQHWKSWEREMNRLGRGPFVAYTAAMPVLMMPALSRASNALSRYAGELGSTAILIAAERHRLKTGTWPTTIDAIDSSILSSAPSDPFSGQPYRMERRGCRIIVYSLGPNGKDEHGEYDPKKWGKGFVDDVGGSLWDIALRRQAPIKATGQ
jgi:hypothetical protein